MVKITIELIVLLMLNSTVFQLFGFNISPDHSVVFHDPLLGTEDSSITNSKSYFGYSVALHVFNGSDSPL